MILALEIVGIITMCIFSFVAIWGFVILKQLFNQIKYSNYLIEKLNLHIYNLYKSITRDDDDENTKIDSI